MHGFGVAFFDATDQILLFVGGNNGMPVQVPEIKLLVLIDQREDPVSKSEVIERM